MRVIIIVCSFFLLAGLTNTYLAETSGKDIFTMVKGPYGSCNTCHPAGGSAGKWDSEFQEISEDGDRKIPTLKGIGKKKTPDQLENIIKVMMTKYKVPVKAAQLKALVDYVSKL